MKILFFSPYFYPYTSGITTYPYKILGHLAKTHQVTVLTFPHAENLALNEEIKGIKIIRMTYLFKVSKGFISPQSIQYFYHQASQSDMIFLNIPNFEGFPLALISKLLNKKLVSVFHCEVFLNGGIFAKIIKTFLNTSVKFQLYLSDIIIAYTKDYINSLSVGKLFKDKIKFVLPPVEKLPVSSEQLNKFKKSKAKKIWLGYAGRISQEKGLEHLINVFHSRGVMDLSSSLKTPIEVVFAGPFGKDVAGENEYYQQIKNLLAKHKIRHHFFGTLKAGALGAFYKSIDVLVLPSVNQTEAFGMVQAEAMLLGTPVIASNLPGVRTPVQLTKMGEIVEPANSQQLAEKIAKIIENKNYYTNVKLIDNASKLFDIKKTYTFYNKLVSITRP